MTIEHIHEETVLTWVANDGRVLAVWHVPDEQPRRVQSRPLDRRPPTRPATQEEMAWRVADVVLAF